mgnify:CR=1 FL=1
MNLGDINRCKTAVTTDNTRRGKGGSGSMRTYNRFTPASVLWLQTNSEEYTAAEMAEELNSTANTIRHKCKALGLTIKAAPRVR